MLAGGCSGGAGRSSVPVVRAPGGFPVKLATANGRVEIPRRPTRIVSLSATATEILYAIGAGAQVVAVDNESSFPSDAPRTGLSGYTPNLEALAGYRPDLVVYSSEPGRLGATLQRLGVPGILQPPAASFDDTYRQIVELGEATGHRTRAADLVEEMKEQIRQIVESLPRFTDAPSYYHELDESYFTATSKTYVGEVYALLGLVNIADPAGDTADGYVQLSGEFILQQDPDIVFLADAGCCRQTLRTLAARPGWNQVRAVATGMVVPLDDDLASRWGPRIVDFIRSVAGSLNSLPARPGQ